MYRYLFNKKIKILVTVQMLKQNKKLNKMMPYFTYYFSAGYLSSFIKNLKEKQP